MMTIVLKIEASKETDKRIKEIAKNQNNFVPKEVDKDIKSV